jgi:6-phosphogluconate dehydrogenase
MVHNGIEYGDMQLISEVYDILKVCTNTNAIRLEYCTKHTQVNPSSLSPFN